MASSTYTVPLPSLRVAGQNGRHHHAQLDITQSASRQRLTVALWRRTPHETVPFIVTDEITPAQLRSMAIRLAEVADELESQR